MEEGGGRENAGHAIGLLKYIQKQITSTVQLGDRKIDLKRNKSKMGDVNTNMDISLALSRWIKVSPPRVTDQKLWLRIESAVGWIP